MSGESAVGMFVGLATLDVAQHVARYPGEDTKTQAAATFLGAGGPAANAAVAFAALSGSPTTLHTALGHHRVSQVVAADLTAHGVTVVDAMPDDPGQPAVSSVVVARDQQTRTVVSLDGTLRPPLRGPDTIDLAAVEVVLADGHYPSLAIPIVKRAKAAGATVVLDCGRWRDSHHDLLRFADVAICSAGWQPPGSSADTASRLRLLNEYGVRHAAITGGAAAIDYLSDGASGSVDVEGIEAIDTLGAGDILHGAFCHFLRRTDTFDQALRAAAQVASASCKSVGTRAWIDTLPARGSARSTMT